MAGLYIHFPYCKTKCHYCDFYSVTTLGGKGDFIKALSKEVKLRQNYVSGEKIDTVYFGGGTPSVFTIEELIKVIESVKAFLSWEVGSEITIEVNPDDVTPGYLAGLLDIGINRISIGIQSWRDEDLSLMNRRHNSNQAESALTEIVKAGFKNISVDLIYGIPDVSLEEWERNIINTIKFDVQHLSVYNLTIESGTTFGKMLKSGTLKEMEEEESLAQYNLLLEKTREAGFINYEISNFAKEGFISKHNTNYWRQIPYIGLGPSAHSFNGYSRQWNVYDVKKYIKELNKGALLSEHEELDDKMRYNEYILTSLRTMWGVDLGYVETRFDKETSDYVRNTAVKYINYGMMEEKKGSLVLTQQGIMISDNIISEFMIT